MLVRVFLLIFFLLTNVNAAELGALAGRVTDADTGQPLPGANVVVEQTNLGGATTPNGKYQIKRLSPGYYTITVTMIGYNTVKIDSVLIYADSTVMRDFRLTPSTISGEEVIVIQEMAIPQTTSRVVVPEPGIPDWNTEEYARITESGFFDVLSTPFSTFAADVDGAAYSNARRFLTQGNMPYPDVVRAEEFINYFSYDYPEPENGAPLKIYTEYGVCPWDTTHGLIHIGLRGKSISPEAQRPSNLVFLLDVSGSMQAQNKLPLLKRAFSLLVRQLKPDDKISIVVYAGNAGMVLPPTSGSDKRTILDAINQLQAGGSTAGGEGIRLAYKVAEEQFIEGGNNRVILATDGDFNVGISSTSELVRFIEEKRETGIFLTTLGFGTGNYKDDRMQELANRGNGVHSYIDSYLEAKKVLGNEITGTLFTIAKDGKIQVEFNPAKIQSYRLIGYENRELEEKDFEDDTKDAGEVGAGHTVTSLYEVIPGKPEDATRQDTKYQRTEVKENAYASNEILTVRIRYKEPDGDESKEITEVLTGDIQFLKSTSPNFRFSAAVAEFAMLLRESEFKGSATYSSVKALAQSAIGDDIYGYRQEFLTLVNKGKVLSDEY